MFVFSVAVLFGRFHLVCLGLALSLLALAIIILKLPYGTVHKSSESWLSAVAVATVGTGKDIDIYNKLLPSSFPSLRSGAVRRGLVA